MSAWPSSRTTIDVPANARAAEATWALRQPEPGVAQWYLSAPPGPATTTSARPSGRTTSDGAEVDTAASGPATCAERHPEPGVARWCTRLPLGPAATMSAWPSGRTAIEGAENVVL